MLSEDTCEWEAAGFSVARTWNALRPVPAFVLPPTIRELATLRPAFKPHDDLGPDVWQQISDVIRHGSALARQLDADATSRPEVLLTVNLTLAAAQTVAAALPPPPPLRATSPTTPLPTESGVRVLAGDLMVGLDWLRSEVVTSLWTCPHRLAATVDDIAQALLMLRLYVRVLPN